MIIEGGKSYLLKLLSSQIESNFLIEEEDLKKLSIVIDKSLKKVEKCFRHIDIKYFKSGEDVLFNPMHSDQYCIFLYFSARMSFEMNFLNLADKIYFLNKSLNCVDLYHQVKMPEVFLLGHPVGSVIGKATIGNFFTFQNGCTVGMNKGVYPTISRNVRMFANSMILGNSTIGENVFISAGSIVKDQDVPSNSLVFGKSPDLIIKRRESDYFSKNSYFKGEGFDTV